MPHLGLCLLQYVEQTHLYSETSLIRHSMGPENNVGLGGCWIMECLLPYLCMVTVPHIMVGLERMLDYRGIGLPSCAWHSCKISRRCCLQIPVMNLLLSFHRALIRMLPSLLLDRLSRTLSRTVSTTGITLFVEKTALGGYRTGRCCPRQTDHPSLFPN